MLDPNQQEARSSYYPQTSSLEPARPRRPWLWTIIAGVLVALLLIGGAGAFYLYRTLFQAKSSIPQLMGEDTQVYITFTPNLSALPGLQRLQKAYPQLFIDQDSSDLDTQLKEELGITFQEDIKPWLGTEMAFAVSGVSELNLDQGPLAGDITDQLKEKARLVVVFTATDREKAELFLDKQRAGREKQGQTFKQQTYQNVTIYQQESAELHPFAAFALVQDFVVFASTPDAITAMIDRVGQDQGTLQTSPRFKAVMDQLPKTAVGYVYLDGASLSGVIESAFESGMNITPAGQADELRKQIKNLKAFQGMGLAFSLVGEGFLLDSVMNVELKQLDERALASAEAARTPVDSGRLASISGEAVGVVTFKLLPTFKDQVIDSIQAQDGGERMFESFEKQMGFDLKEDLLDWLVGDALLVVLPGEKLGAVELPATGYLSIRPQDKSKAEAGMRKISKAIEQMLNRQGLSFEAAQVGGVTWQAIKLPGQEEAIAGGFGFNQDDLVIGFGKSALNASAKGHENPLTQNSVFKEVSSQMIDPNSGMFYVNLPSLIELIRGADWDNGVFASGETAKVLKPIQGIGSSSSPGFDENGLLRSRLFILIAE